MEVFLKVFSRVSDHYISHLNVAGLVDITTLDCLHLSSRPVVGFVACYLGNGAAREARASPGGSTADTAPAYTVTIDPDGLSMLQRIQYFGCSLPMSSTFSWMETPRVSGSDAQLKAWVRTASHRHVFSRPHRCRTDGDALGSFPC